MSVTPLPAHQPHRVPLRGVGAGLLAVVILFAVAGALRMRGTPAPAAPLPLSQPTTMPIEATGKVLPVRWARIASLVPGYVKTLPVEEGARVTEGQVLFRVEGNGDTTVVVAPFAGVIAGVTVRAGEVLPSGQAAMLLGDLSRYEVETTDLNEYVAAKVRVGQQATAWFDAVSEEPWIGTVKRVAVAGQPSRTGDILYPATITFASLPPDIQWGMTARLRFEP